MKAIDENIDDFIIDKCLIIDNKFEEVRDIIFELNKLAVSTDYRDDVLSPRVKINPNTQLVILDLYMSENQNSVEKALQSVGYLNDNIRGPFFLLIWTKHKDKFRDFINKLEEKYSQFNNFPIDIKMLPIDKIEGEQNEERVLDAVNEITKYIFDINNKFININSYIKMTKIFQEQSTMLWQIFKPEKYEKKETSKKLAEHYEKILGQAFDTFDRSFNYEKSGKGFLNVHARFLENELTLNHLNYESPDKKLDNKIKKEINSKLIVHSFDINEPESGMPGLIYKIDDENINKLVEFLDSFVEKEQKLKGIDQNDKLESISLATLKYKFFKLNGLWTSIGRSGDDFNYKELMNTIIDDDNYEKIVSYFKNRTIDLNINKDSFVNDNLNELLLNNVKRGKLIITPYCDFAHGKKSDVLYLEVLILNGLNHNIRDIRKMFKKNVNIVNLHNGKFIMYIPSQYKLCDLKDVGKELYKFYISKEYVNEIQINVANSISRIGTTIIE